jgi:hypothetical protein
LADCIDVICDAGEKDNEVHTAEIVNGGAIATLLQVCTRVERETIIDYEKDVFFSVPRSDEVSIIWFGTTVNCRGPCFNYHRGICTTQFIHRLSVYRRELLKHSVLSFWILPNHYT